MLRDKINTEKNDTAFDAGMKCEKEERRWQRI